MLLYKKLESRLNYLKPGEVEKVYDAFLLAEKAHQGQKRQTGDDYIFHPVEVSCILADLRMDKQSIMAGLLHDVLEDTVVDKKQLVKQFGKSVAELVDGVSKLTQIEFKSRVEAQAENFRKMLLAMSKDIRVILVKLADRLHNMRTLSCLSQARQRRIARETLDIFSPIAKRLGMHSISIELEELGFKYLYPYRYKVLDSAVKRVLLSRKPILKEINQAIDRTLAKAKLKTYQIQSRKKHLYSLYKKMRVKKIPFSEIMDVYAVRIVVDDLYICYQVLGLLHSLYKPVSERFKDYIAIPKANGYQSLHTVLFGPYGVPIEAQIRTHEMHQLANTGIAAHWLYKTQSKFMSESQVLAQQWVKNLLAIQHSTGNSLEFIENVKIDLFPDEVYVFTPKGGILELPAGATAVDFAYAVHTEVGNTCVTAKADRQFFPLSAPLVNGQTLEIINSPSARPNPVWLNSVVTGKARSSIRHYLKNQKRQEAILLGKQLLEKNLAQLSLSLKLLSKEMIVTILSKTRFETLDDLFEDIGLGNRAAIFTANRIARVLNHEVDIFTSVESEVLMIKGTEGMVVEFASCCHPIPGDAIVSLLKAGQGIEVHMERCSRIKKSRHIESKWVPVRWADAVQGDFSVVIQAELVNKKGSLAMFTTAIAKVNADIDDLKFIERSDRTFLIEMCLLVKDRLHLAHIIRACRRLKAILRIARQI